MQGLASPYAGPRPYRWDEADKLFGRDRELGDLCNLVASYRVTLLYAQSGAGKSSLVAKMGNRLRGERGPGDTIVLTVLMFTRHGHGKRFSDVGDNAFYWYFVVASWLPIYMILYWLPRWW